MDHLSATLKKGGIKDITAFFPVNKRTPKNVDTHFRAAGLPQVADWFAKRQAVIAKELISRELKERLESEDSNDAVGVEAPILVARPHYLIRLSFVAYRLHQRATASERYLRCRPNHHHLARPHVPD